MGTATLVGNDTINFGGRILSDLPKGDVLTITYSDDLISSAVGKNGNVIYSFNESGRQTEMELKLLKGSADDKYFQGLLARMMNDFPSFVLLDAECIKRLGDGKGNVTREIYTMSNGVFTKNPETKVNTEGDTEQAITVYHIKFSNSPRSIAL